MIYNYPIRKKKSAGLTWYFNDTVNVASTKQFTVDFVSNETSFNAILTIPTVHQMIYHSDSSSNMIAFKAGTWTNQAYRTVTFQDPPTGDLLTWLQANAVKQQQKEEIT